MVVGVAYAGGTAGGVYFAGTSTTESMKSLNSLVCS